jgi:V8-like Glu-specific endopeptidase
VGAGFLVSPQYVLTCAHVVIQALGLPQDTTKTPAGSIDLDFPLIAAGQKIKAQVVFWQPINPLVVGEDIAGLKLDGEPLDSCQPVRLVTADDLWDHPLRVFGFPRGGNDGVWAAGVLRGEQGNGWVQMEAVNVHGYQVEQGFSGAPVWDETLSGVVGMAVAAARQKENVKAAFMIPTKVLSQVWSELDQWVQAPADSIIGSVAIPSSGRDRVESLRKHLENLRSDLETAYDQLAAELDDVNYNRLERKIEILQKRITKTENQLKLSGG